MRRKRNLLWLRAYQVLHAGFNAASTYFSLSIRMKSYVKCIQQYSFAYLAIFLLFIILLHCLGLLRDNNGVFYFANDQKSLADSEKHDSCLGRYIYIQDLPNRFNTDIVKNCSSLMISFGDMCPYVTNRGLGPHVADSNGILQGNNWYATNQFMLEIIFHNRMKQYKCLTNSSSLASAIYVPFYAGLDVGRYLFGLDPSAKDSASIDLLNWLMKKPEWNYMNGNDHFLVAGRVTTDFRRPFNDLSIWGNKLLVMPQAKNMTFLIIESCQWCTDGDIAIPYPSFFHPSNDHDIYDWQDKVRKVERQYLYAFIGAPRPERPDSIRNEIVGQCLASMGNCKWLNCTKTNNCDDPMNVMGVFQSSKFCLQPPGDTATRRSTFDSILAGCIPVFFHKDSAYTQYLWHLPKNYTKYSVFIFESDVKDGKVNIEEILSGISEEEVFAMREEVVRMIPRVSYANPMSRLENFEDAFDIAIKGVIDKVENIKRETK